MLGSSPNLERKASRIENPVERLKYLRRHAQMERRTRKWVRMGWLGLAGAVLVIQAGSSSRLPRVRAAEKRQSVPGATLPLAGANPRVWQVEGSKTTEVYSNGLRIELKFATNNRPRARYPIFTLAGGEMPVGYGDAPRGIVYHLTESQLEPLEEEANHRIQYLGRNLLDVIRTERAYHYLIDRFGRVFRVVEESDAANHAGKSVWADSDGIYVNLNDSFLSIAFEGQTEATEAITLAQVTAARMLTEMLRWRYPMPVENFVTHAQVSVNPLNMKISPHTDWAQDFPFAALGLPDNYAVPPASLYAFGFIYDETFLTVSGGGWKGLAAAEDNFMHQAAHDGTKPDRYRAMLQQRYKNIAAALEEQASKEQHRGGM